MVIFRTTSALQIFLSVILKAGYLACAGIALSHYSENPPVTIIVAVICLIFFALTGTDEIHVYPDHFVFIQNNPFKIYKKRTFLLSAMQSIVVSGNYNTADELSMPANGKEEPLNRIEISLVNGNIHHFTTSVYISKLNKAVQIIMHLKKARLNRYPELYNHPDH